MIDGYIAHINEARSDSPIHAVFANGTVVILDNDPLPTDALPFTRQYIEDWPIDRLESPDDLPDYVAEAALRYADACSKWGTAIAYAATTTLLSAGYPVACTSAVSTTTSGVHIVTHIDFADGLNLVDMSVPYDTALLIGAENRRLDWMFPHIVEIIRLL